MVSAMSQFWIVIFILSVPLFHLCRIGYFKALRRAARVRRIVLVTAGFLTGFCNRIRFWAVVSATAITAIDRLRPGRAVATLLDFAARVPVDFGGSEGVDDIGLMGFGSAFAAVFALNTSLDLVLGLEMEFLDETEGVSGSSITFGLDFNDAKIARVDSTLGLDRVLREFFLLVGLLDSATVFSMDLFALALGALFGFDEDFNG